MPTVIDRESSARTYGVGLPIVPVRADGMRITADDGRTYLDCLSGAGALALGHNHPVVTEAIRRTLDLGAPLSTLDLSTPIRDAFVDELFVHMPAGLADRGRIHFCGPTGADAVEAGLKLTRLATGRTGLLAFTGAYHGMTAGAIAATGNVAVRHGVPAAPYEVTRLPFPDPRHCPFGIGGDAGAAMSLTYIERLLNDPNGGVRPPAAMLVEPVQGEGGVVPAPPSWLTGLRDLCTAAGVPLVVDEVQTGVGRTGTFFAVDADGVTPDVMVLSKAIGGGLPLAVIVYDRDLDGWPAGAHTGTFRGNQLAMAAGAATMRFVAEHGLSERAERLGTRMMRALRGYAESAAGLVDVRGRGLMIGVEASSSELSLRVQRECLRRDLIVERGGRHGVVVRLLPPLTMTDAEAASVVERLCEAWSAAEASGLPEPADEAGSTVLADPTDSSSQLADVDGALA